MIPFERTDRDGMDAPGRVTPRTEGAESSMAQTVEQLFRHDATCGIARAEKQDVISLFGHT
jgi:hypothetical protein